MAGCAGVGLGSEDAVCVGVGVLPVEFDVVAAADELVAAFCFEISITSGGERDCDLDLERHSSGVVVLLFSRLVTDGVRRFVCALLFSDDDVAAPAADVDVAFLTDADDFDFACLFSMLRRTRTSISV